MVLQPSSHVAPTARFRDRNGDSTGLNRDDRRERPPAGLTPTPATWAGPRRARCAHLYGDAGSSAGDQRVPQCSLTRSTKEQLTTPDARFGAVQGVGNS
jgi:hypothetical protein